MEFYLSNYNKKTIKDFKNENLKDLVSLNIKAPSFFSTRIRLSIIKMANRHIA
jgi:hypothetical protein